MKGSFILLAFIILSSSVFSQRVKRKGTTPIQLNPNAAGIKDPNEKKQQFTIAQVQGKWQEHGRSAVSNRQKLSYTDTLMINISKDKAEVREGMSMNMKGDAAIEDGDGLVVAGDTYTIKSISNGWLILDDGEFLRALQQVEKFYLETVGKDSIRQASYENPKAASMSSITGKWVVYRREAKPGTITNDTELVKSISILNDSSKTVAKGEIVIYKNDISEKLPCIITLKDNNMQVVSGKRTWNFDTFLADNNEFVFGKAGDIIHYAKKL